MDKVDQHVGEEEEQRKLNNVVEPEWCLVGVIVKFSVSTNIEPETGSCQCCHADHAGHCLFNFQLDLVLQELGMLESALVENEPIRKT